MIRIIKYSIRVLSLSAGLILFSACGEGTDTGNPASIGVKFVGIEAGFEETLVKYQTSDITITDARLVLKEIQLEPLESCLTEEPEGTPEDESTEEEFDFNGPFVIDLLDNSSFPEIGTTEVPAGAYCEIEVNFDELSEEDLPDGLSSDDEIVGEAMIIEGTRSDGTPFIVRFGQDNRFKLEGESAEGFDVDAGGSNFFFISFNKTAWFEGVDLDNATLAEETIVIDDESNTDLRELIVQNIIQSTQLFRDLDGDLVLDDEERDDSLVLGEGIDDDDD